MEQASDEMAAALQRAETLLDFRPTLAPSTPANAALAAAEAAAARHARLMALPQWLAAPSRYQQHWIRYSLAGLAGLWSARFLYRYAQHTCFRSAPL